MSQLTQTSFAPHRIRCQRWQVKAPSAAAAFALRSELRATLDRLMLPAFERAFDKLGVGDEVVRIPRLTLNLEVQAGEDFGVALAQALGLALDEVLHEMVNVRPQQSGVLRQSSASNARQILVRYLAEGRLDWPSGVTDATLAASELREQARLLCETPSAATHWVVGSLAQRQAICFRLLQLLPDELRWTLLQHTPHFTTAALPDTLPVQPGVPGLTTEELAILLPALFQKLSAPGTLGNYLLLRLQALWLALRNEEKTLPLAHDIVALLRECGAVLERCERTATLRNLLDMLTQPRASGTASITQESTAGAISATTVPDTLTPDKAGQAEAASPSTITAKNDIKIQEAEPAGAKTSAQTGLLAGDVGIVLLHPFLTPDKTRQGEAASRSAIPAKNDIKIQVAEPAGAETSAQTGLLAGDAGIVLLHPFLTRLFDVVGIVPTVARELPQAVLPRAAALLHWLITGRQEIFEFELVTIKVLLGLTPDQMLPVAVGLLSDEERHETDDLLEAAIAHWGALGKTSPAALRASFLQRRGVLRNTEQGWQLQVEPESFDMLLGKLPWGIAIVKLPWMTRPIFTEWPTH